MIKKFIISEEQYNVILEETEKINFSDYDDEDYLDAFFLIFRNWIKSKHGEEQFNYPTSYLLKKYSKEFIIDTLGRGFLRQTNDDDDDYRISRWEMHRVVKEFVTNKLHKLPTVQKNERFLDKYESFLDMIIPSLELPNFVKLTFEENDPQRVRVVPFINYVDWLKYPERFYISSSNIERKLTQYLENFLGVEFGNPAHGQTHITFSGPINQGEQEWIKNELNKKLKKKIRELPNSGVLKAIRFTPDNNGGEMKLIFKDTGGWNQRREFKNSVQQLLTQEGYGPNLHLES